MRPTSLLVLPLILLLGGCSGSIGAKYDRVDGQGGASSVGAAYPKDDSLGDCHEDRA